MSSVITLDFEKWKAQQTAAGNPVVLDEFVFAYVPNLDPSQAISRDEKLPAANHIVHRQAVNKTGLASENAVAYSVTLGTEVGNFDFNWIGLINKASGIIGMITHAPAQKKIKTANGLQGNVLTRSFLLEFEGAAKETAITTTAETWQIDFTARLTGMDDMQRLINTDSYGEAAFFGDSFAVIRNGDQYTVKKGLAYVGGLRGVLEYDQTLSYMRNTRVYADFSYQGNLVSQWKTVVKITVANDMKNYVDAAGYPHYVFAIASVDGNGDVTDLRSQGTLSDRDIADLNKELGKIKRDYATNAALTAVNHNAVPNSRKINGKSLTDDINLTAHDVDAYSKSESDNKYLPYHSNAAAQVGALHINNNDLWPGMIFQSSDGHKVGIEGSQGKFLSIWANDPDGNRRYTIGTPQKNGKLATLDDINSQCYTKTESDGRYHPAGNYALQGESYTKSETDNKYLPYHSNATAQVGALHINNNGLWPGMIFQSSDGHKVGIEGSRGKFLSIWANDPDGNRRYTVGTPQKNGLLATLDDINIPVGVPLPWPHANTPAGYFECNGQRFDKSGYPKLAEAYPAGQLPDLRGEFIRGLDNFRGVDPSRGALSWQNQQVQYHAHVGGHGGRAGGRFGITTQWGYSGSYSDDGKQPLPITNDGSDFDGFTNNGAVGNETRPRNIAFLYIVRAA
ncbi:phage tail protein [Xenorhabdus miraniensis]|uniref:Sulfurtransferase n=1 Tax=Xenorhabdus miraniensis TaxID=351674 RepID=A0A2D0JQJ2_9GAMM|nr:phage tail protein [Xenorhabdus miraniensis]PHM48559.1 sulfurtransferase [Xenorhabdus miraniensis]